MLFEIKNVSLHSETSNNQIVMKRNAFNTYINEKAEENLQAKSLRVFVERNQGLKGMRLSMSPYREQDWLANYPLYSVSAIFG